MNPSGPLDTSAASDVSSPGHIIAAMYRLISGTKGGRDWERIRNLYLPGARLIPTGVRANGEHGLHILDIEAWIDGARPLFAGKDFFEVEVARRMEVFGNIAQAFSTYECRWEKEGTAFMIGINSIHLLHKDARWWIVTVFWDNETPGNPIPAAYRP